MDDPLSSHLMEIDEYPSEGENVWVSIKQSGIRSDILFFFVVAFHVTPPPAIPIAVLCRLTRPAELENGGYARNYWYGVTLSFVSSDSVAAPKF
ncbi:hypothetical protein BC937DRAFT_92678 [Endogone sp. FLAS-F59071]|nr:hypothetical protein BC937DRAFT_92678 [Endogone sp. FLAS-F59071]|eukprot:RUS15268.1 hypothetical protein BC937DRAFT_92678 [Endogone sp. FLAS-F59071]